MPDSLADEAAPASAFPRPEVVQGQRARNFHVLKSHIAKHGATLGCKACSFVRHGTKAATETWKQVASDDDGRIRRFLDNNAPERPVPEVARIGGAAPAVAVPTVRTVGGVSCGSSAGGARPSPTADQNEESTGTTEVSRPVQRQRGQMRASVFLNSERRRESDMNHLRNPAKTAERGSV